MSSQLKTKIVLKRTCYRLELKKHQTRSQLQTENYTERDFNELKNCRPIIILDGDNNVLEGITMSIELYYKSLAMKKTDFCICEKQRRRSALR